MLNHRVCLKNVSGTYKSHWLKDTATRVPSRTSVLMINIIIVKDIMNDCLVKIFLTDMEIN